MKPSRTGRLLEPSASPRRSPVQRQGGATAGLRAHLSYSLEPGEQGGDALGNPLFELLSAVVAGGSIRQAALLLGVSYRHLWDALKRWEKTLGEPLIDWSQGRKARLSAYAERLLWAERGVRTRLQPQIEALRSELTQALVEAREGRYPLLTVRASWDIALPVLQQHVAGRAGLRLDIGFPGSLQALQALNDRQCLVAGFHVPDLEDGAAAFRRAFKPLLSPDAHRLIACSHRTQGLILRREHAGSVRSLGDVARLGLRFASRQPGSGTRILVDHLARRDGLSTEALAGLGRHVEQSDVAVALCVASGVADAGAGIEAAALQLGLHFVPLAQERYFLACHAASVELPAVACLREALASPGWREILAALPGYRPADPPGAVLAVEEALPWWRRGA